MEVNERVSHIICSCGVKLQVLVDEETWDELATAELYRAHLQACAGGGS